MGEFQIYNASAGSGKTYALVKNYLKICLSSNNRMLFREILAITFTNKAANEMKDRILDQLMLFAAYKKEMAADSEYSMLRDLASEMSIEAELLSNRAKEVLTTILHNYSAFSVSTIDTFTNRLVRSFAHDLKLSSTFELEIDGQQIIVDAIDKMLSTLTEGSKLTDVLVKFINEKQQDEKSTRIESDLSNIGQHLMAESSAPYTKQLKSMSMQEIMDAQKSLRKERKELSDQMKGEAKSLLNFIHAAGLEKTDFSGGYVYNHIQKTAEGEWKTPVASVLKVTNGEVDFYTKGKAATLAPKFAPVEADLLSKLQNLVSSYNIHYPRYHLVNQVLSSIYSLATLRAIEENLSEVKEETNRLPLAEFNKIISEKLKEEPSDYIFEKLGDRYSNFFIDEFQDTSILQWENLVPLVNNGMAAMGSAMLVGDAKQSIYRWRGGDVAQFMNLSNDTHNSNKVMHADKAIELYKRHQKSLDYNYRSRKNIVQFNSDFFTSTNSLLKGEDFIKLYDTAAQGSMGNEGGYVSLQLLNHQDYAVLQCEECELIVKDALSRGFDYSDITIIMRSSANIKTMAEYFVSKGIPVVSSEGLLVGSSKEVLALISFLRTLERPTEMAARFDFLAYLWNKPMVMNNFQERHIFLSEMLNATPEDFHKKLETQLPGYQYQALLQLPVIDRLFYIAQILDLNLHQDLYLHALIDHVHDYQNKKGDGAAGFLQWWDEKGKDKSIELPPGINAVQMMTIHKSKGLEFSICIVPFANWNATSEKGGSQAWMVFEEKEMYGLPVANVKLSSKEEQADETYKRITKRNLEYVSLDNYNMGYVAFTRAVDELYVLGKAPKNKDNSTFSMYLKSYMDNHGAEDNHWQKGEKIIKPEKKEPKENDRLTEYKSASWLKKLKVSVDAPLSWTDSEEGSSFGKLVHSLLARVSTMADVEKVLSSSLANGEINSEQLDNIKPMLKGLMKHQDLQQYFEDNLEVLNEADILIPKAKMQRPDRVVVKGKVAHIIDYKTGKAFEKHKSQVASYQNVLAEMGYEKGDRVLVYLQEELEVVKW